MKDCEHLRGVYEHDKLICDACHQRVGDHYVYGLNGLRWDVSQIAIGHPDWNKKQASRTPGDQP